MIPVDLRLTNFMSYGTTAPSLDFDQFHVACLSGRNGQGKSALLDAMTWALWGQARKSSGSHKPDDELIRIGTREMRVEFVFDLEGERYRVSRSYTRSKTGKTSYPELELQVYEPEGGGYRPLTGASIRETQQHLDGVLGLDYDTFINSAFLLQGRSDEFTKKKPSERKDILARILNLSRYDRLAEMARDRERTALERLRLADLEIDRLKAALEDEPAWKADREAAEVARKAVEGNLEEVRAEEQRLTEVLAGLEARQREADEIRRALEALGARAARHQEGVEALRRRIVEAEKLLAQHDRIQRDYERYQALSQERETLDQKRELHRGLEKQVDLRMSTLNERRREHEHRLHQVEVQLRSDRKAKHECALQLAEEPALRRALEGVSEAVSKLEETRAIVDKRRVLREELTRVERDLVGRREALQGRLGALRKELGVNTASVEEGEKTVAELDARAARRKELGVKFEDVQQRGQGLKEAIEKQTGRLEALREERGKIERQREALRTVEEGVCPTCGTDLTPSHREEVEASYRRQLETLSAQQAEAEQWVADREVLRDRLRSQYQDLKKELEGLQRVPEQLATATAELKAAREALADHNRRAAEAEALEKQLAEESYAPELATRRRELQAALDALPYDEAAHAALQQEAGRQRGLEEQLRRLEQVRGRDEQLARSIEQAEREAGKLRQQLEDGTAFAREQQQIDILRKQMEEVGFDPEKLDRIRRDLGELSEAQARVTDLLNAQSNNEDWKKQLAEHKERLEEARKERAARSERLTGIEAELSGRADIDKARTAAAGLRKDAEVEMQRLQRRLGELSARLEQAARDRKALQAQRKVHAEAKADRTLNRHLKVAFGKHGIPSLIIEQTLPEVEDRANVLLDQLSDGRMHVRLETLKDKKSGGTRETLEIIITDEQGVPRAYETFSGGEAFRVNFALRIALAQLLAERSGVRIRTLVVDEGFGTQDAHGVENMVEAIQAIQDDFEKILVITHLDQLKEAFPVRIEVRKDPAEGSTFEIVGV